MKAIPVQQDDLTSLSAADFNNIPREEENLILSAGGALTDTDMYQMAKAVADYAASSAAYTDIGTVNSYILTPNDLLKAMPGLHLGAKIRFKATNTNDSTSCTLTPYGLPAKGIHFGQLSNGGTPLVPIGSIVATAWIHLVYDETPDGLTQYWRINKITDYEIATVGIDKLRAGNTAINDGSTYLQFSNARIQYSGPVEAVGNLALLSKDSLLMKVDNVTETALIGGSVAFVAGTNGTRYDGRGVRYETGAGEATFKGKYTKDSEFTQTVATWAAWTIGTDTTGVYVCEDDLVLTGIPIAATVYGVSIRWDDGGPCCGSPVCRFKDDGTNYVIDRMSVASGPSGPAATFTILVHHSVA